MSLAKVYILKGKIPEAIDSYKKGLAEIPIEKSPFGLPHLTWSSFDTIQFLKKLDMPDAAKEAKRHAMIVFPYARNIRMA